MPLRLRTSTIRRNGHVYRYHQLVRAVRNHGKPSHEVVAHLGRLDEREADAIRGALQQLTASSRDDMAPADLLMRIEDVVAQSALRYLDVQVVHQMFLRWGLREFFEQQVPREGAHLAPADVLEVLILNRCLAPCSKLRVTEWVPKTALPELLNFPPSRLNNTRVHRVLDRLDGVDAALTAFLVNHPLRGGLDSVIYLDFTDTWFVGRGGELATEGLCKDGSYRASRVQIALGVDSNGLPLRWEMLPGNVPEAPELPKWLSALSTLPPFDKVPLVFDRGFSTSDNLKLLVKNNRRFVTCARQPKIKDWVSTVDFEEIIRTPPAERPGAECLKAAGLTAAPDDDDLFYIDQGVRKPHTTRNFLPAMRVVPFFRPSQYAFETHRIRENRRKLLAKVDQLNAQLACAKAHRDEDATLRLVRRELQKRKLDYDYRPRLEPLEVHSRSQSVRSFQIHLDPQEYATACRDFNAGWRILLASPEDDRPAVDLIRQYDHKQAVEYAFRTIKSFVKLRPVRHQRTPKIRAHVTICMLALLLDRWLELQLRKAARPMAADHAYEVLEPCRLHVLRPRHGGSQHWTVTEPDEHQRELLAALNMHHVVSEAAVARLHRRRH